MRLGYKRSVAIVESVGMSVEDGLAFTVCGGQLVNGQVAPDWVVRLNGSCIYDVAEEVLERRRSAITAPYP